MKRAILMLLFCGLLASLLTGVPGVPAARAAALGPAAPTPAPSSGAGTHRLPQKGATDTEPTANNGPVLYWGGPVVLANHRTHAIFWGTGFSQSYKNLIVGFLQDVAAASGAHSNVYFNNTQYWQSVLGQALHIVYDEHFAGAFSDPTLPAWGCFDTHGGTTRCINDAQIRGEVSKAILLNGWAADGLNNEYFVFLPDGVSTCDGSGCAFDGTPHGFCAYHGAMATFAGTVTYANMPFDGHDLFGCRFQQAPNNHPAADTEINALSHEANETITDPLPGQAWVDVFNAEIGDKCVDSFGAPLGGAPGAEFNQTINGHHYWLQEEWSNASLACVQRGH